MLVIGLTGGIGSGKSTVASYFAELGVPVASADKIARELLQPDSSIYAQVIKLFGQASLNHDGTLNRQKIRQQIFSQPLLRQQLEQLTHPLIRQKMHAFITHQQALKNNNYCVLEIPLLLESSPNTLVNRILIVNAPEKIRKQRILQRDVIDEVTIDNIIKNQASEQRRKRAADDWIDNTGTNEQLRNKVVSLHRFYLDLTQDAE